MNAWPPQASYPCGNFSDTSSLKLKSRQATLSRCVFILIHFQGWLIRQVSCYTLLSGFRLSWPPTLGCNPKQPDSPKRPHAPQSVAPMHGAISLSGTPFLGNFGRTAAVMALLQTTIRQRNAPRLQAWAVPTSLAATGGILVSLCLNSAGHLI